MKFKKLILCAIFTALTAIFSQLAIPIGPIPINLATLAVLCSATLLGPIFGALSMLIYLLLGVVGVPVFSMMQSGPGVLAGPTGGYIIGYIFAALIAGIVIERLKFTTWSIIISLICGYITYTAIGTFWYMYSANATLLQALTACVLPFIIGDTLKMIVAFFLTKRLKPIILKMYP